MTRESIGIKCGDTIKWKQAEAILTKFLLENRCVEPFVESCNFKHNRFNPRSAKEAIGGCISRLIGHKNFHEVFDWGYVSFVWAECTHIKSLEYWRNINAKWKDIIDIDIIVKF